MASISLFLSRCRYWWWRFLWRTQGIDYLWLLPAMSRLPIKFGFLLAGARDALNARLRRDWRSMSLGYPHIAIQSYQAYKLLDPSASPTTLASRVSGRFVTESRCDFEAYLLDDNRVDTLKFTLGPEHIDDELLGRADAGLLLMPPHFDSFFLGIAFLGKHLARTGQPIHVMSSAVFEDPRVHPAIPIHLRNKYRGLEHYLNGGKVLDLEDGLRPFYKVLERGGILVVVGDSPPVPGGVAMDVDFLGARRTVAGGAVQMARRYGSRIGSFVCKNTSVGHYQLDFSSIVSVDEAAAVNTVYGFLSQEIGRAPEKWWAADLLTQMPIVSTTGLIEP